MNILFDSLQIEHKAPFGALKTGEACRLRILIPSECGAFAVCWTAPGQTFPLEKSGTEGAYDVWSGRIALSEPGIYLYHFQISDKNGSYALYRRGRGTNIQEGEPWQLTVYPADCTVPEVFRGRVYYQIFPDRFAKSGVCDLTQKLTPYELRDFESFIPQAKDASDFAGGNLRGITEKLDYLKNLGIGAIYLNPIFLAASNHRYDTADYLRIDPMLGTDEDFSALCAAAHARGLRVILDGVFSHTGSDSVYFDAKGRFGNGAVSAGSASPYYKWYDFQRFPDRYTCWWGVHSLPCVNERDPAYQAFILETVLPKWLALGADGFRLDVADELPDAFIAALRKKVKTLKPEAIVIGEVWEDASNKVSYGVLRRYFTGRELDGVINYPFRRAILAYASGADGGEGLAETVMTLAEHYPPGVLDCTMSVLGTHDTERLATVLPEKDARKLAAFLQFTLPGSPVIYYGDEAGLAGGRDPMNRLPFPWGREDLALTEFYRLLAALKNENAPLQKGSVEILEAGGGVFRFRRVFEGQAVGCLTDVKKRSFGFCK